MRGGRKIVWRVTPGFLLVAAALFYWDSGLALWGGAAAVVHELGHAGTLTALGGRVGGLELSAAGAKMTLDPRRPLSYGGECLAALAGPAASLAASWVGLKLGWFLFGGLNLAFCVFNLLPVGPLDGGRALYSGVAALLGDGWGTAVTRGCSIVTVGALLGLGAAALVRCGNFTLILTALWLLRGVVQGEGNGPSA